jgi:hypothetical protein
MSAGDRTWYVIAAWGGNRRKEDEAYRYDRATYLKRHLAQLSKLRNGVERVIVMVPECSAETEGFRSFLRVVASMPGHVVHRRRNVGMSYGSFSDAFGMYRQSDHPDWWIFSEDDYVPMVEDFDRELRDLYRSDPSTGILCGVAWRGPNGEFPLHVGHSSCIASHDVLERVWGVSGGKLPHSTPGSDYLPVDQVEFGRPVISLGLKILDTRSRFCCIYYTQSGEVVAFHDRRLPPLWAPLQGTRVLEDPMRRANLREVPVPPLPEVQS